MRSLKPSGRMILVLVGLSGLIVPVAFAEEPQQKPAREAAAEKPAPRPASAAAPAAPATETPAGATQPDNRCSKTEFNTIEDIFSRSVPVPVPVAVALPPVDFRDAGGK